MTTNLDPTAPAPTLSDRERRADVIAEKLEVYAAAGGSPALVDLLRQLSAAIADKP